MTTRWSQAFTTVIGEKVDKVQLQLQSPNALEVLLAQERSAFSKAKPLWIDCAAIKYLEYPLLQALLLYGNACLLINTQAIKPQLERYGVTHLLATQEDWCHV